MRRRNFLWLDFSQKCPPPSFVVFVICKRYLYPALSFSLYYTNTSRDFVDYHTQLDDYKHIIIKFPYVCQTQVVCI